MPDAVLPGRVAQDVGNKIRRVILDWVSKYRQPNTHVIFSQATVRINAEAGESHAAVELHCSSGSGNLFTELMLQKDAMDFADELKSTYGITLDELETGINELSMSFLAPDGKRIPPARDGG